MEDSRGKIFLFRNTREVLKAEKWCIENHIKHKVMPVPRHISSECGMSLQIASLDVERLSEGLKTQCIIVKIHSI